MSKQIARKHHFIPQFYIKGFSNKDESVYVYDLKNKKVSNSPKKASQIFYKEHLHTIQMNGQKSLLIEGAYSELEGLFCKMLSQIKRAPDGALKELIKIPEFTNTLILMLSVQYWRNPISLPLAQQYSSKLIELYDQALPTNYELMAFDRKDIKFFQKKSQNPVYFKYIQFLILPLLTFKFTSEQVSGLRVLKLKESYEFICSDNPVSIDGFDNNFKFLGEVFYPLSSRYAIANFQFQSLSQLDKKILSKANEKVIASSKERLNLLL